MELRRDLLPLDRSSYDAAIGEYTSRLAAQASVRAVYRFGSIAAPGISDIDLLVVLADDARPHTIRDLFAYRSVTASASYLYSHPPVIIPERLVPNLHV